MRNIKKRLGAIVNILLVALLLFSSLTSCNTHDSKDSNNNLFVVCIDDKYGFINVDGEIVIEPQYENAWPFSDGLALVWDSVKTFYIDSLGNTVLIPGLYEDAIEMNCHDFSEGLSYVDVYFSMDSVRTGYMDKTGSFVIEPQFLMAFSFSEGLAVYLDGNVYNGKWGYIDRTGNVVIEAQYDDPGNFSEDVAFVKMDGKYGFINKKGDFVIEPKYERAGDFHEGLAPVSIDGLYGYINKEGVFVIEPKFEDANTFHEGLTSVDINGSYEESYGYIDKKGKCVIKPQFDIAGDFSNGLAYVCVGDKEGYINKKGKWVWSKKIEKSNTKNEVNIQN